MGMIVDPESLSLRMLDGALGAVVGSLLGAAVGGAVVYFQTRATLKADVDRRSEERGQETKSLAVALLCEAEAFYKIPLLQATIAMRGKEIKDLPLIVKPMARLSFPIYISNADKIGLFNVELAKDVVTFYAYATELLTTFDAYGEAYDRWDKEPSGPLRRILHDAAAVSLEELMNDIPEVINRTRYICVALAERAGVPVNLEGA